MKIKNTTTWPDAFLRAMTLWICETIDLPKRQVKLMRFGNRSGYRCWGGVAYPHRGEALTRVTIHEIVPGKPERHIRFGVKHAWTDRLEILVAITAHELCHIRQHADTLERECDRVSAKTLDTFRERRQALLDEWKYTVIGGDKASIEGAFKTFHSGTPRSGSPEKVSRMGKQTKESRKRDQKI